MTDPVQSMAKRARHEPYFLGAVLERYARAEKLDDPGLAAALGCTEANLPPLRLCRAPRLDPEGLTADVGRIAGAFGLEPARLLAVVKRAAVLAQLQDSSNPTTTPTFLMAARDRKEG